MADTKDLKSFDESHSGSSPDAPTNKYHLENPFTCWSQSIYSYIGKCDNNSCNNLYVIGICVFCSAWFCWKCFENHIFGKIVVNKSVFVGLNDCGIEFKKCSN